MLKKFDTKELVFIALIGALVFAQAFILGVVLIAATGTSMTGGLITAFTTAFILVLAALTIQKFGTITIIVLIHTVLSSPTINLGPPGVYKIGLGIILGLVVDSVLYFGKYKRFAYYISFAFGYAALVPAMFYFLTLLGMPAADKLAPFILPMMGIYVVESLLATWLARVIYFKKLKNKRIIKQIED